MPNFLNTYSRNTDFEFPFCHPVHAESIIKWQIKWIRWTQAGAKLSAIKRGKASDDYHLLYCLLPDHIKLLRCASDFTLMQNNTQKNHFCLYRILNEWHLSFTFKPYIATCLWFEQTYPDEGVSLDNMICFNKHKTNFLSTMQIANVANCVSTFFFFLSISYGCE